MSDRKLAAGLLASIFLLSPEMAFAYIGPGLGVGALAAVIGVFGSIFLGLFAVLYYPIKRMMKRRRAARLKSEKSDISAQ